MNKYFNKLGVAIVLLGLLGSCEKQLDKKPTDVFAEEIAFSSVADLQMGMNNVYAGYISYVNKQYATALISDEAKIGTDNSGQGLLTYRFQFSADNTTGGDVISSYPGFYGVINRVNRVLPHIDDVPAATTAEQQQKVRIKGELLAMRAIAHFDLLQMYAGNYNTSADALGVAYVTISDPFNDKPSRISIVNTLQSIEKDFDDATPLLSTTFSDTAINAVNLNGFRARVALYKGDYQKAIDYATTVINSNTRPLVDSADFRKIWTDDGQGEILFRLKQITSTSVGAIWTTTGNSVYIAPSDKLTAAYSSADVRLPAYIGTTSGKRFLNKFYTSTKGGRVVDLKVLRTAEMHLIRAEAYGRLATPNLAAGADDLNAIRAKRIKGYTNEAFSTASSLLDAVLNERFKELCFEGSRFWDLKRYNLGVNRLATDAAPSWQTLPAGDYRFVLPIPFDAILANGNIKQNPNYN